MSSFFFALFIFSGQIVPNIMGQGWLVFGSNPEGKLLNGNEEFSLMLGKYKKMNKENIAHLLLLFKILCWKWELFVKFRRKQPLHAGKIYYMLTISFRIYDFSNADISKLGIYVGWIYIEHRYNFYKVQFMIAATTLHNDQN